MKYLDLGNYTIIIDSFAFDEVIRAFEALKISYNVQDPFEALAIGKLDLLAFNLPVVERLSVKACGMCPYLWANKHALLKLESMNIKYCLEDERLVIGPKTFSCWQKPGIFIDRYDEELTIDGVINKIFQK